MPKKKLTGRGDITPADERYVKWVGKTKAGKPIEIVLTKAYCKSNVDLTMAEKDDIIPELEFEGLYDDAKLESGDFTEPWELTYDDSVKAGNGEIVLGAGKFYVGTGAEDAAYVGLSRGGGSFVVQRTYREIAADDDPGAVSGRIQKTEGRPLLKLKALQWLTKASKLWACVDEGAAV